MRTLQCNPLSLISSRVQFQTCSRLDMALLNRRIRRGNEYPKQICFLDGIDADDSKIIKPEQLGLPVVGPETNNNEQTFVALSHTIYILKEFENNPIFETLEKIPNVIVMGITAVAEFVQDHSLEFRSRPLFCTSMNGFCFHIDRANLDTFTAKRMVNLIKWMGGMFCQFPTRLTTHMVTTSTLSDQYIYCSTFNVPVITPEWVEECWKSRELVGYKAQWSLDDYLVKAFQGLYISLKGFDKSQEMQSAIEENGGVVVPIEDKDCTHLIIPKILMRHLNIEDIPFHIIFVVSEEWLISSIEFKRRDYEGSFGCYKPAAIMKTQLLKRKEMNSSEESKDTEESLASDGVITQALESSEEGEIEVDNRRNEMKKYIYKELCDTEKNYMKSIQHLVDLQKQSTKPGGEAILSQIESKIIFSNLEHILEIHKRINEQLTKGLKHWGSNGEQPGAGVKALQIFTKLRKQLMKEYVIYSDNFEDHLKMFRRCESDNLDFQTLTKTLKSKGKGDYQSLFIKPIQRLASISLLLKELNKNTTNDDSNKQLVLDVIETVASILQLMNDTKAETKEREQIFDTYNQIEGCPPNMIAHHRKLVDQMFVSEITDKSESTGASLMLFIFNDVVEVAKVKSKKPDTLKKSNKAGQVSAQKPYKHLELILLSTITHVLVFGNDGSKPPIFGFNIKNKESSRKKLYSFFYLEEEPLTNKIETISKCLYISNQTPDGKSPQDYVLKDIPRERLSIDAICKPNSEKQPSDIKNMASKAVRSVMKKTPKNKNHRRSSSCSKATGLKLVL